MAEVIGITDIEARRAQREADREAARAAHPSLRWVAGAAFYVAHRKTDGQAACGARGSLVLAPPGVPLCVECFPTREREPA